VYIDAGSHQSIWLGDIVAITSLSLPIDIPWRRLCVSPDMLDANVCDRQFPYRWRSSIAVFSYVPPDEHQSYQGMALSYLKVVCTITGFQPDPDEVGLNDRRVDSHWNDPAVIENYKEVVGKYYGCYGAILEVAIGRRGQFDDARTGAYFADFEPKKREVYELVSETGEMMSRSLEDVNVHKGATTAEAHEVLDIFGGISSQSTYAGTGGGGGIEGQWGTRDLSQTEYTNIRTIDQARESRETFSHSTQLTQMYHQLSSYHLGTNRAVFFLLPRPHIVQSEATFVNGPRLLEGVQEFFLVVLRPRDTPEPCIEAYLETGHIASIAEMTYETSTGTLFLRVTKTAEDTGGGIGDDSSITVAEGSETYMPPDGWEVDLSRDGGYKIESADGTRIETYMVTAAIDHVTAFGGVSAWFEDTYGSRNKFHNGLLELTVTVYIRRKTPMVSGYTQTLYLTGRGVCCCPDEDRPRVEPPTVAAEVELKYPVSTRPGIDRMSVRQANEMRAVIGTQLIELTSSPDRYPRGTVRFGESNVAARAIAGIVRRPAHPDNVTIADIASLSDDVRAKVQTIAPNVSRGRLLMMSIAEQADRFGLNMDETLHLRRAVLGLEGPVPDPRSRWDPPGPVRDRTPRQVPNVLGLPLAEARAQLASLNLHARRPRYADSPQPRDTVLRQRPAASRQLPAGSEVELTLSTGLSVRIPDVVGSPLSTAVVKLRDAGLLSEPVIIGVEASSGQPSGTVVECRPVERTWVTPNHVVTLRVAGIRCEEGTRARRRGGRSRVTE
jgi:hypothetical protein